MRPRPHRKFAYRHVSPPSSGIGSSSLCPFRRTVSAFPFPGSESRHNPLACRNNSRCRGPPRRGASGARRRRQPLRSSHTRVTNALSRVNNDRRQGLQHRYCLIVVNRVVNSRPAKKEDAVTHDFGPSCDQVPHQREVNRQIFAVSRIGAVGLRGRIHQDLI